MLETFLTLLGAAHVGVMTGILLDQISLLLEQKFSRFLPKLGQGEDRISALPDDLLVRILSLVPTKDVVATMFLSKRWRFIWTMVPKLEYIDNNDDVTSKIVIAGLLGRLLDRLTGKSGRTPRCIWRFLDESLRLHKAQVLEHLCIQLGQHCPVDVDVLKWVANAVDHRKVRELGFVLSWSAEPTNLPKSLYLCDTLVSLGLSDKIIIDVPSQACLPSLKALGLYRVMYKDEDSLVRLFSSCPILKYLAVQRHHEDNVKHFNIKVPSLEVLWYNYHDDEYITGGTLDIDSPALKKIFIEDYSGDSCSIENKPCFGKAKIGFVRKLDDKFKTSLASLVYLELFLNLATVPCCKGINFSKLIECKITLVHVLDWSEPFMLLLRNSPNLKIVFIDQTIIVGLDEDFTLSWNQPSSVPECLSASLEIFEWKGYEGISEEKEIARYIFSNSKRLKRAGISITISSTGRHKMMKELESMYRISQSSQLLFSTQLEYLDVQNEMNE